jgi:glycerol-3-phosphate O-acyltransferase/dihydroxyacetone phosphate acyltransferase
MEKWSLWYAFLRQLVKMALHAFYRRRISVSYEAEIPKNAGIIFIANHQNSVLDPILMTTHLPNTLQPAFITRGDVFAKPFLQKLFTSFKMLPIFRKRDGGNTVEKNKITFAKCSQLLQDKASIILFPEGNQAMKKHLREMKKGTAHMAFQAAQATDFQEVIYIIPVGLEYENYLKAGRKVALRFGKTISVASYYEQFQKNEKAAIESLTNELANMISPYLIDVKHIDEYEKIMTIHQVCEPFLFEKQENDGDILAKNKTFIQKIERLYEQDKPTFEHLAQEVHFFLESMKAANFRPNIWKKADSIFLLIPTFLLLIFGLPFYVYGLLNNFLPYRISHFIATKKVKDLNFYASVLFVLNLFIFPIFYIFQTFVISCFINNYLLVLLYFASLPITFFYTPFYQEKLKRAVAKWRFLSWKKSKAVVLAIPHQIYNRLKT